MSSSLVEVLKIDALKLFNIVYKNQLKLDLAKRPILNNYEHRTLITELIFI